MAIVCMHQARCRGLAMIVSIGIMAVVALSLSLSFAGAVIGVVVLSLVCEPIAGVYLSYRVRAASRELLPKARVVRRR